MGTAEQAMLLAKRNSIARELGRLRAAGCTDEAEVARLRAQKDQADAALDALGGPAGESSLTLRRLLAM